jgi:hypothetical protein
MIRPMRRVALYGVGLLLAFVLGLTYTTSSRANGTRHVAHTCTPTDRDFIETAKTNMAAISLWGEEYLSGDAPAQDVAAQSGRAAKIVSGTTPMDSSLAQARQLLVGVFTEYEKAMQLQARHRSAGKHIFHAYGLANFAHDVLAQAAPALAKRGCDVAPLL